MNTIPTWQEQKNAEYRMALLSNTTFEFLVKYISDNRKKSDELGVFIYKIELEKTKESH